MELAEGEEPPSLSPVRERERRRNSHASSRARPSQVWPANVNYSNITDMATIPSSTSMLRTLASKTPTAVRRAPLFLPYSSRASSSTSPPSSFPPRNSFVQPIPPHPNAQSEFGLRPPEELRDPATQRAMSLPPHMRPRLLPVDKLSQTRIYVSPGWPLHSFALTLSDV